MTNEYKFNVGDEIITTLGERGKIVYICECSRCKNRGFDEPIWVKDGDSEEQYISSYMAANGFQGFYRIGSYHFNEFEEDLLRLEIQEYEEEISDRRKRLAVIKEILESEGTEE